MQSAPPLGALIGTVSSAPIIDSFNKKWGNTQGVIFGQAGDPYKNNYSHFNNLMNIQKYIDYTKKWFGL